MADIVIRPMGYGDLNRIMEMEHLCFSMPWSRASMESELYNSAALYLVLEEDGIVCAYAGTWLILDEGHITNVAVHPDFRRKGYGKLVLKELIRASLDVGVAFMDLEVRVSNAPAIALYKGLGFKKAGIRKGYYEDNGEDAQVMINDRLEQALAL